MLLHSPLWNVSGSDGFHGGIGRSPWAPKSRILQRTRSQWLGWCQALCSPGRCSVARRAIGATVFLGLWVLHVLLRARWSVSVPPEPLRRKGRSEQPFTAEPSRLPGPESQPPPHLPGFPGGTVVNSLPASAGGARDVGSIPGSGRSPGEGNDNPLQSSCLENPMGGGAGWATVHGVAKSRTRLSNFTFTFKVA